MTANQTQTNQTEEKGTAKRRPFPVLKTRKTRVLTGCALLAAVLSLLAAGFFILNKDSLRLKGSYRVSMLGEHSDFTGRSRMRYNRQDGSVTIENEERKLLLSGIPVYSLEDDTLILSAEMGFYNYSSGRIRKLNHFAGAALSADGQVSLSPDGKKQIEAGSGFLHDGKNTYIFLEPVEIRCGDTRISLAPLSYVTVLPEQGLSYYSAADGEEAFSSSLTDTVYAAAESGLYTLNLTNDTAELSNGKSFLLAPGFDSLETLH